MIEYYKTKYGLFPINEEYCFNCRYHMRDSKSQETAECYKSGITTDITGWCKEWKHILKRNLYRINLDNKPKLLF